ncbi:restriction endonuclease subunit S [Enterocloster clostridioformis]|uniref:Restriction endonuclease subunit S n=1 Tax=Enterocloster clostridioformis TaxID=1531 RepID=A0ABD6LQE8_9FIRM|nr:restriction endonuclease subunit S [Enterocloster clostridioformis]NSJ46833.1 restriction endonuclease subunit S [Enterocloster clostridioformis]
MLVNVIDSITLFKEKSWSIMMLFPHDELRVNEDFKLVKLGDLVKERKENMGTEKDGELNYVGLENIESGTGRLVNFSPKPASDIKSGSKRFELGDILYGRLRPNLNKVFLNEVISNGRCSTEILVLEPDIKKVNPMYLSELLRTKEMNTRIVDLIKGAALPRVNISDLLALEVPLPKLDKQNDMANMIKKKRIELEEHIRQAEIIPIELNKMIVSAYS